MSELEHYIDSYFGFGKLDAKLVSSRFKLVHLSKGEYYTETGKYCSQMGFIQSGVLRVFVNEDGKEITQWISSQGEFVTDLSSFMFDAPARWNIQALEDCDIYTISKEQYDKIGELVPSWSKLEKLFLAKCFVMLENRVYSFLSKSAEERYEELYGFKKQLFNHIPLQYLASMLGMTPETLSRIRKRSIS